MKNLLGEHIATSSEIVNDLLSQPISSAKISHRDGTKQGFLLTKGTGLLEEKMKGFHGIPGIYVIYRGNPCESDSVCWYVGESQGTIGGRLSRFVKEVTFNSRRDEDHAAGRKWRNLFGEDLSNAYVRVFDIQEQDAVTHKEIEDEMVRRLKPLANQKRI